MPVEIRELVITAQVEESTERRESRQREPEMDKKALIEECVEQVMEILEKKKER